MTDPIDHFETDFTNLQADAESFNDRQTKQDKDLNGVDGYNTIWGQIEAYAKSPHPNPEKIFAMLMLLFSRQGFDVMEGQLGIDAGALKIQGDLTKLGGDLEKMPTTSTDTSPKALQDFTQHLDQMLDLLGDKSGSKTDWHTYVHTAIGEIGADSLYQNVDTIRKEIYWDKDPNKGYNPTPDPKPDPSKPRTYYFDASDGVDPTTSNYICSFVELRDNMGKQGDPKQASEASKTMTDSFNANTSTTQSLQAASNEIITAWSNQIKAFQGFTADMMHAWAETDKAATQNQGKA